MELDAYRYTNPGGRSRNEDSADCAMEEDRALFVLADGLGGHQNGDQASQLVVNTLLEQWRAPDRQEGDWGPWLTQAIAQANRRVLELQQAQGCAMKSTVAALVLEGTQAAWAHVGDSRIYRLSNGHIDHATQDHSVTYKKFLAGEIGRLDINFDEDRSSLLRVVGDQTRCLPDCGGAPLQPGDGFLLCSDGFWECLYDEEILIDFLKSPTAQDWAETMLVRALPRMEPGGDNLTLMTIRVEERRERW